MQSEIKTTPKLKSLQALRESIKNPVVEAVTETVVETQVIVGAVDKVSLEEVIKYINIFNNAKKASNEMNQYTVLANRTFTLDENMTIHFDVDNDLQVEILNRMKQDLLDYLRKETKCNKLNIEATVSKEDSNKRTIYTMQDKLNFLIEQNPLLQQLRIKLGLEL